MTSYYYWKIPDSEPFFPRIFIMQINSTSIADADEIFHNETKIDPRKSKNIVVTLTREVL